MRKFFPFWVRKINCSTAIIRNSRVRSSSVIPYISTTLEFLIIAALRLIFLTQNGQISSLSLITKFLLMKLWFLCWHDFSSDVKSNQILSFPNQKSMWAPMNLMMSAARCNYYGIAFIRNSRVMRYFLINHELYTEIIWRIYILLLYRNGNNKSVLC